MIKANGEYLDFNGDIEIESRIKLFEEISTSNGDFSYDIEIQDNGHNRRILGIPRADTVKTIYQAVPAEVIDDTGQSIYLGKLQVNRISNRIISSTFYAGNTEWFALLSEPMSSIPLFKYDVVLNTANVVASWSEEDGIVFPIIDGGGLVSRSYQSMKLEDFMPCFYVKTLFKEIFSPLGIKVVGDFIDDPTFNKLLIASNSKSQEEVEARSAYANKTIAQTAIISYTQVTFQDDSNFPFFDGSQNNFSTSRYTADVKMFVTFTINLNIITSIGSQGRVYLVVNGANYKTYGLEPNALIDFSKEETILLEAGDYVEVYINDLLAIGVRVNSGTFKAVPIFIYYVFGKASVPQWTQLEFVSNILRLFNVLPSYNTNSKTLTLDLFNNIKTKEYVDISQEVIINEIDFSDFVSSYAKNNLFVYQESEDEDLRDYNISNFVSYGSGNLTIDNAYIENEATIVDSDFTSPITYLNGVFDMSMERIQFTELDEILEREITSVSNSGGVARFNIGNADDYYLVGNLVRIETDLDTYNGDWVVDTVTSTYITVKGGSYDANASGSSTLLRHKFTTDDSVYIFINIANTSVSQLSSIAGFTIDESATVYTTTSTAYFNMLSNGRPINRIYKQSLSFGTVNNPLSYQLTLLDAYWPLFSRILNSPVSLLASGYLKRTTFDQIKTFLRPVRIETEETTNLYYVNRNTGYKGSERPCELELIKLN